FGADSETLRCRNFDNVWDTRGKTILFAHVTPLCISPSCTTSSWIVGLRRVPRRAKMGILGYLKGESHLPIPPLLHTRRFRRRDFDIFRYLPPGCDVRKNQADQTL